MATTPGGSAQPTPNPVPGGAGNPAAVTPVTATAAQQAATQPTTTAVAPEQSATQCTEPPPTRLPYTRHATTGDSDDRIVNPVWYKVLVIMFGVGGVLALLAILFGGFQLGKASVPTYGVSAPMMTSSPAPTPTITPPVQPPQVIQPMVVQPVVIPPVIVQIPTPAEPAERSAPPELSDAEQRNEALKDRLRRRYGIQ